jgi:hypothetical protein
VELVFGQCKAIINITERQFVGIADNDSGPAPQLSRKEIIARVKTFLGHSQRLTVLTAYFNQTQLSTGFSVLNPTIIVGKTLPDDSVVFRVVRAGDVKQLQSLLYRRECTLRDKDTSGTPLLHVCGL